MGGYPRSRVRKDLMRNECRHVMPSGLHCQSPAMRGSGFCYFHARPQRPTHPREARIEMPSRLDSKGAQLFVHRIMEALANGHISARRGAVLLYGLQMSSGQAPPPVDDALKLLEKLSNSLMESGGPSAQTQQRPEPGAPGLDSQTWETTTLNLPGIARTLSTNSLADYAKFCILPS